MPLLSTRARTTLAGLGALVLLAGGMTALSGADAATPAKGRISAGGDHSTSWTGGPFAAANATGNALEQPDCSAPGSCDDFKLHVRAPRRYSAGHQLRIEVSWPNSAADFDIYLLDDHGHAVATAATTADPELILAAPRTGDYVVRVVPYLPLGQSYKATAALVKRPDNPAPGSGRAPRFRNYKAPKKFADANDAGEPSIGNSFKTGATFYQAYLSTYKVRWHRGRAAWHDVSANATNGCVVGSTESLDPILFTDHKTGRTFESQLSGQDSLTCYTDDGGKTWLPSQGGGIPAGADHQTFGGGPYAADGVAGLPTSDYPHAVYYCSQDIATALCAVSHDGGTSFGPGIPVYKLTECGGLHGHIKVARDGTAYLPNKACGSTAGLVVSRDNGQSWTIRHVKPSSPGDSDPSVGIDRSGAVYFGYVGADGRPGVAVSHDRGKTWVHGQLVGGDHGVKNAVFPAVVAGGRGRAAFAYLGTTTGGNYQATGRFKGVWHLYISTTYDGGRHWVTRDATPHDPVQRGSICTAGTTCGDDRNLLDFMDVTIDKRGRILVAYADGCIHACVDHPRKNGHDAYATIARQTRGRSLFARFDR